MSSEMTSVLTYAEDYEYSVQMIRWLLKPISVWPLKTTASLIEKILSDLVILLCTFLILFMLIPSGLSILFDEAENIATRLKDMGPFSFWLGGIFKYASLVMHAEDIRRCVDHMEQDWKRVKKVEDRNVMLKSAKMGRVITGFCMVCLNSGIVSYCIVTWYKSSVVIENNNTYVLRYTPYPFYSKILDTRYSPAYDAVFAMQFLSSLVICSIMIGSCGLAAVLVMHAHGQLAVLISSFDELIDGDGKVCETVEDRLTAIVKNHLRVLSFTSTIQELLEVICLTEILATTVIICVGAYCGVTEWSNNHKENIASYCVICTAIGFNLFVYCSIGESLSEQSEQVGETAYMTEWYRLPGKSAVGVILIIVRSNSVSRITAGKMIPLCISTYSDVLKTILTYFNMLRAVTYNTDM